MSDDLQALSDVVPLDGQDRFQGSLRFIVRGSFQNDACMVRIDG